MRYSIKDITGQRFGRLVATKYSRSLEDGRAVWLCDCDCGTKDYEVRSCSLVGKRTRSCGCINYKHGEAGRYSRTQEYNSWIRMWDQGRAKIMAQWLDYEVFLADMGRKPPNTWLRRHDTTKPHGPGNSFWGPRGGRKKKQ